MIRHKRLFGLIAILSCCLIGVMLPTVAFAGEATDEALPSSETISQEQALVDGAESEDGDDVSSTEVPGSARDEDESHDAGDSPSVPSNEGELQEADAGADDSQIENGDGAGEPVEPDSPVSAIEETVVVTMAPSEDPSMVVDIVGGSQSSGAAARLHSANSTAAQRFRIEPIEGSEYSYIFNVNSEKVLDVRGAKAVAGASVQQFTWNQTNAQRWIVSAAEDGSYLLFSALKAADGSYLVLGLNESTRSLELHEYSDGSDLWLLTSTRTVEDGVYTIASGVAEDRVIDIVGGSMTSSANVQTYSSNGTNAQRYSVAYDEKTGYYTIASVASGMVLDVAGASKKNGANVQQYRPNGSAAQQWSIEPDGDGYVIVSRASGLVLDVLGGSSANGANIQQFQRNGSAAQHWVLSQTSAVADGCYVIPLFAATELGLDVRGGSSNVGGNIQLYQLNGTDAQSFEVIEYKSGLYTIRNVASGLFLGLEGGSATLGANVELEAGFPLMDSKLWMIRPGAQGCSIISVTGLALDVAGGVLRPGTNVRGYEPNGTKSQLFVFKSRAAEGPGITDVCAVLPNQDGSASPQVLSARVGGETYLFLPAYTDVSDVHLGYLPTKEGELAELATSEEGPYAVHEQLGPIDLTEGYETDELGGYLVWIRPTSATPGNVVHVMVSANIRSLFIMSDDPEVEGRYWVESSPTHDNAATGSMLLVTDDGTIVYDGGLTQIKGRGNGSWIRDKKPYQIKLSKKTSLLDGSGDNKAKTWVLLANRSDTSLVHDFVTKKLGLELGLEETPDCEFVDLYYDGEYRGTYQLSEKVQIGTGRVDIDELEEANEDLNGDTSDHPTAQDVNEFGYTFQYVTDMIEPEDISGGYLVELDNAYYDQERSWFETSAGFFVVKSPEDASYGEVKYISELLQRAILEAMQADGNLSQYFDIESLVKVTLLNELSRNPDYIQWSSTYFYKDSGDDALIECGPAWDFDMAYGMRYPLRGMVCMSTEGLSSESYGFYANNEQYLALLKEVFESEFLSAALDLLKEDGGSPTSITGSSEMIAASWAMDHALWGNYQDPVVPIQFASKEDAVEQLWSWTAARLNWMASYLMGSESPVIALDGPQDGRYVISSGVGGVLDIAGGSLLAKANLQTWKANGTEAQLFSLRRVGTADTGEVSYVIYNVRSGLVLDVSEDAGWPNACQKSLSDATTQTWVLRRTSSDETGRYQVINVGNGLALTMSSANAGNGVNVRMAAIDGSKTQEWYLTAA